MNYTALQAPIRMKHIATPFPPWCHAPHPASVAIEKKHKSTDIKYMHNAYI